MSKFIDVETRRKFSQMMNLASEGTSIMVRYTSGDYACPYQKFEDLWYACGIREGFSVDQLMEISNIVEVKLLEGGINYE